MSDENQDLTISNEFDDPAGACMLAGTSIRLPSKYKNVQIIAKTSMNVVARALDSVLKKDVAIKFLIFEGAKDDELRARFLREAKTLASLDHPNIVKIFYSGVTDDGTPYYVMEFLDGKSLAQEFKAASSIKPQRFFQIMDQVLSALAYASQKEIVHRDLKPSNIIICESEDGHPSAKIIDFGIAFSRENLDLTKSLTRTGCILGTPAYMSPEQCRGQEAGVQSDIYSLGCIMYECLMNTPPLLASSTLETLYLRMNSAAPSLAQQAKSEEGRKIGELIDSCLQSDLSKRPKSMEEVRQNLRGIFTQQIDTLSLSAPKPGKGSQRKRIIAAFLLASLLIGTLLVSSLLSRVKENSHVANSKFEAERIKGQKQKKRQLQAYVKKLTADIQRERRVVREHLHQADFPREFDDLLRYRYSPLVLALLQQKNYEGLVATLSDGLNDLKEFSIPNDDNKWEILFLAQRSDCYLKLKSYKSAAADVEAAQNFLSKRVNQSYEFYVRFARTKLLLAQNNLKAAFTEFNLAIPSFGKIGFEHQFGNSTLFDVPRTKDGVYKVILQFAKNTSPSTKEEEDFKRYIITCCLGSKESEQFSHLTERKSRPIKH